MNTQLLNAVSEERLNHDLFYLCRDPFSFRSVTYTIPWHTKNSLDEFDGFLEGEMKKYSSHVRMIPYKLRPFRCDSSKELHHWYSAPLEEDPWYDGNCIEVTLPGTEHPDEIIQLVSHKDSMSWINSPGACDNAVGTIANMELVRILSQVKLSRTVRVLFCNEEHSPWYSKTYAEHAASHSDQIIAVLNQDSLCGKSAEEARKGPCMASAYSVPEGKALADLLVRMQEKYQIPIRVISAQKDSVNDDDGSFIRAGYLRTVINCGSWPYSDEEYHLPGDIPERVNIRELALSVQLLLAAVLEMDEAGESLFP